ncbi:MAG TPA: hypothetical protein VLM43_05695 [Desulfobacterales bacterium]|nr:hypothetical protein [Desulfobacterales bacterium]
MTTYWKYHALRLSVGNLKLGDDTIIFNMGPSKTCPSKTLGMCQVCGCCYAGKAERIYPEVLPYRNAQRLYWLRNSAKQIADDFVALLSVGKRADKIKWFRINEAGDFWSQDCVDKINHVAATLYRRFKIRTYGYTARHDLDYSRLGSFIALRGSGHDNAPHGRTEVRSIPKETARRSTLQSKNRVVHVPIYIGGEKYFVCPGNCRNCNMCKIRRARNIVFPKH